MKVAITGTIGSGKSSVSEYIRSKEIPVFDCDKYNNFLLENNESVFNKISNAFPECIEHLRINKKKLAKIVFNDEDKRQLLESITHPLIIQEMLKKSKESDLFFAEVPLLFEKDLVKYFDLVILIVSNDKISQFRLSQKGYSQEEIENRMLSQLPVQEKIKKADEIIYNNGSYKDLYKEIDRLLYKYDWE